MNTKPPADFGLLEGKTFIIGREGHIYIESTSASRHHAEIKVIDGKIHLRDLNSTNGTYLVKKQGLVHFKEGYVNPLHTIMIGDQHYLVIDLLATARDFAATDDTPTNLDLIERKASSRD